MSKAIIITETEINQGIAQYGKAISELVTLLQAPKSLPVIMAFERWTERRGEPWQVLFIEAKHHIQEHGTAPWL